LQIITGSISQYIIFKYKFASALVLSIILIFIGLYRYFQIKGRLSRYYIRNYQVTQHQEEERQEENMK